MTERLQFANEIVDDILDSADKPLNVCEDENSHEILPYCVIGNIFARVVSGGKSQMIHGKHWLAVRKSRLPCEIRLDQKPLPATSLSIRMALVMACNIMLLLAEIKKALKQ